MGITFTGQNNYQFSSGYYCGNCGKWVYYNETHCCYHPEQWTGTYYTELKHYKCPQCKGEFSEPFKKFTGKYKDVDIKEFGSEVIIGNTKVPIEKYVCPFCSREMKGLNQ